MASVTGRIKQIKQPYGGYLPTKTFTRTVLSDGKELNENENVGGSIIGLAVDYLTRIMLKEPPEKVFFASLSGARLVEEEPIARKLLSRVQGLDNVSIVCACKLSGFDVCFRSSIIGYKPIELIKPDLDTISNIKVMVERSLHFFELYGPITTSGFTFEGGYTSTVNSGDGDFCTKDTLWDFKVSKKHIVPAHTLQVLMYYIMGFHSKHVFFKDIKQLGFFNPRLNTVYTCSISDIPKETINIVEKEVLCYSIDTPPNTASRHDKQPTFPVSVSEAAILDLSLSVDDVCRITGIPKSQIYKDIRKGTLNARKKGNKYLIEKEDLDAYLDYRKKMLVIMALLCGGAFVAFLLAILLTI